MNTPSSDETAAENASSQQDMSSAPQKGNSGCAWRFAFVAFVVPIALVIVLFMVAFVVLLVQQFR